MTTKLEQVSVSMKDKVVPTCNWSDDNSVTGKGGVHYLKHGAFCLETQKFPDGVNNVRILDNMKYSDFSEILCVL